MSATDGAMGMTARKLPAARWALGAAACLLLASAARGQDGSPPPPPPEGDGGPTVKDTSVGYIDSAIPFSHFRLRYDAAYRNVRPTRAEFFWPRGGVGGPGLPLPEPRVDYQDITSYLEWAVRPRFSLFV